MPDTIQTKRCPKCKNTKLRSEFNKNRSNKNGLQDYCKSCQKILSSNYQTTKGEIVLERDKKRKKIANQTIKGHLRFTFSRILGRCNNPKNKSYKYYGGRGIKVKFASPDDFYDYVVNELKADPRGLTIDRIDNDGDYQRGNIRFVTRAENNRNKPRKRRNHNGFI